LLLRVPGAAVFNIVRCDIPKQRFYFAGYELWINDSALSSS